MNTSVSAPVLPVASVDYSPHFHEALRWMRGGYWLLLLGFGGFLLWAGFAPLDQGVVGSGTVVIAGERKVVQPSMAGTIDELLVHEGDDVTQGQVLLRLNTTHARSDYDVVAGQWISARSVQARLTAERLGQEAIVWPDDLQQFRSAALSQAVSAENDARVREALDLQQSLFNTRRSEMQSRISILEHEARSLEEQLGSYREIQRNYTTQLQFQQQELEGLRELVKGGNVPRTQVYEAERRAAQMNAQLASSVSDVARIQQQLNEMSLKIVQEQQVFRSSVESDLTQVSANVAALEERLKALEFELKNAEIVASVSGQVMGLAVHTQGGVVALGQKLMDIVPQSSRWIIRARFPPMVADRLERDLPVAIRFGSLQRINTPVLEGRVATVSADQLLDEASREPYFAVDVNVADDVNVVLQQAGLVVRPGMQAEVIVRTGERTLFNYLLRPLTEKMAVALKEE